ncbi:MAG: DUF655 domain-containing protein [Euryarchaeota archaeon]|nr:DUF655 domain-containing protein [Euryarchaeota archaeon]
MEMEEYAIVLDFLATGYPENTRPIHLREPIAQVIGEKQFTLLEIVPRREVSFKPYDRVYIGKGQREQVEYVRGRIPYEKLTATAKVELPYILEQIATKDEARFIEFFNKCQPITTRLHQLELLPGIGKKLMWSIIEERKKKPFQNFADISARVHLLPDPKKMVVKRIIQELEGREKYYIFVPPPRSARAPT